MYSAVAHDFKYLVADIGQRRHRHWCAEFMALVVVVTVMAAVIAAAVFSEYRLAIAKWYLIVSGVTSFLYFMRASVTAVRS